MDCLYCLLVQSNQQDRCNTLDNTLYIAMSHCFGSGQVVLNIDRIIFSGHREQVLKMHQWDLKPWINNRPLTHIETV